jgi:hypothetical protein
MGLAKPVVAPERGLAVPDRAHAVLWLPALSYDLLKRDLAQWDFAFGFAMPETQGATSAFHRTLWTAPVVFPEFALDHNPGESGFANADLYGVKLAPRIAVPLTVERVDTGVGGPTDPTVLVLVDRSPDPATVTAAVARQDADGLWPILDRNLATWIPTGLCYVHVLANGSKTMDAQNPGTSTLTVSRWGTADCCVRLEQGA